MEEGIDVSSDDDLLETPMKIRKLVVESDFTLSPGTKVRRSKRLAQKWGVCISESSDVSTSDYDLKRDIFFTLNQQKQLDTHIFEFIFEKIWNPIEEERRKDYTYFNCLWFNMYNKKKSNKEKVMSWIKKKDIFSRKYVFVPIICRGHWSLLILCDFGLKNSLVSTEPFMIFLDSLREAKMRLEPSIRKFVSDIYKHAKETDKPDDVSRKMPFITPKVMQQKNDMECGLYVLYFMRSFLQLAPANFSPKKASAYFADSTWQNHDKLDAFSQELLSSCQLGLVK